MQRRELNLKSGNSQLNVVYKMQYTQLCCQISMSSDGEETQEHSELVSICRVPKYFLMKTSTVKQMKHIRKLGQLA